MNNMMRNFELIKLMLLYMYRQCNDLPVRYTDSPYLYRARQIRLGKQSMECRVPEYIIHTPSQSSLDSKYR